jgi:hypothetical protein
MFCRVLSLSSAVMSAAKIWAAACLAALLALAALVAS